MQSLPAEFNPFALMLDPQAVLARIESSERLERLQRRICRPLDKILPGVAASDQGDAEASSEDVNDISGTKSAGGFDAWRAGR